MPRGVFMKLLGSGMLCSSLLVLPYLLDLTLMPRLLVCGVFLLAGCVVLTRRTWRRSIAVDPILLAYAAFVAVVTCSLLWAGNRSEALPEVARTGAACMVFAACAVALALEPAAFARVVTKTATVVTWVLLAVAAWQLLQVKPHGAEWRYQIIGLNGHKNLLCSCIFLLLFFLAMASRTLKGGWRLFSMLAVPLCLLLLLLLRAKAVWAAVLVALVVYGLLRWLARFRTTTPGRWYVGVLALTLLTGVFFGFGLKPLSQAAAAYLQHRTPLAGIVQHETERLLLWQKTYHLVERHPLLGVGAGNWQIEFPDATLTGLWRAEDLNFTFQRPHNDFLWLLSETGWLGFVCYLCFVISLLVLLVAAVRAGPARDPLTPLAAAALAGWLVISFFDFPKERVEHLLWSTVLSAVAWHRVRIAFPELRWARITVSNRSMVWPATLALCIVFVALFRVKGEWHLRHLYAMRGSGNTQGVIREGTQALSVAFSLDPTSVPVDWYIGNAFAAEQDYTRAKRHFLYAYRQNPYQRNVLNDLGSAVALKGSRDSAEHFYREALRISPRFDDPRLNLTALYIQEKNYRAASTCLDSLLHDSESRRSYRAFIDAALSGF